MQVELCTNRLIFDQFLPDDDDDDGFGVLCSTFVEASF